MNIVMFSEACQEAMELYLEQMKLQAERKPLPKQESKAYTKIKVSICKVNCTLQTRFLLDLHSDVHVY